MKNISSDSDSLNFDKIWHLFKETDRKFKETDKMFQETTKELKEQMQDTDKKIKALSNLFTTQWGKLIESLVEPSCLKLFQEHGIKITLSTTNVKVQRNEEETEYDILLVNDTEIVVIEVKTTFRKDDLQEFIDKLKKFKYYLPQYQSYKVYGAIAGIRYDEGTGRLAYKKGLFVIKSSGENILKIANDLNFKPVEF
ncbi:MAG: DUF3883 domain-containing protein [Bacteroidetes bacterium]|nr:DUF3883 domain-containing protein [Bacteroidota bacterium]